MGEGQSVKTAPEKGPLAISAEQVMPRSSRRSLAVVSQNWPKTSEPLRKALVLGVGLSGLASAKLLSRLGFEVIASDRKLASQLGAEALEMDAIGVNLIAEETAFSLLGAGYGAPDLVVPSPGIPRDHALLSLAREKEIEIAGEMELAARHVPIPILAVTGSNGKSTVTALTGHVLERSQIPCFVGGNIGLPLSVLALDYLNDNLGDRRYAVIEVSSFQLETVSRFMAKAATFLNLSPDHLDRHGDMKGYFEAKCRIFNLQGPNETAVLNLDDPYVRDLAPNSRRFCFSRQTRPKYGAYYYGGEIIVVDGDLVLAKRPWSDFRLIGDHNVDNVMAATGLAMAAGVSPVLALAAATSYSPSDHRLQPVGEYGGIRFVDDSKGTNVGAVASAIQSFSSPIVLILGGRDKDLDFSYLAPYVREKVKHLVLMGECREKILKSLGGEAPHTVVWDMAEAVSAAIKAAKPGDVVLLSPACASFDLFENYKRRGEVFAQEVKKSFGLEPPSASRESPGGADQSAPGVTLDDSLGNGGKGGKNGHH
jgi:UDP-N-acetylmuramoylalanine--D-glutamate ligase